MTSKKIIHKLLVATILIALIVGVVFGLFDRQIDAVCISRDSAKISDRNKDQTHRPQHSRKDLENPTPRDGPKETTISYEQAEVPQGFLPDDKNPKAQLLLQPNPEIMLKRGNPDVFIDVHGNVLFSLNTGENVRSKRVVGIETLRESHLVIVHYANGYSLIDLKAKTETALFDTPEGSKILADPWHWLDKNHLITTSSQESKNPDPNVYQGDAHRMINTDLYIFDIESNSLLKLKKPKEIQNLIFVIDRIYKDGTIWLTVSDAGSEDGRRFCLRINNK